MLLSGEDDAVDEALLRGVGQRCPGTPGPPLVVPLLVHDDPVPLGAVPIVLLVARLVWGLAVVWAGVVLRVRAQLPPAPQLLVGVAGLA